MIDSEPPATAGGALVAGTYDLTERILFTYAGGATGPAGEPLAQTILLSGSGTDWSLDLADLSAATASRQSMAVTLVGSGGQLRATATCPGPGADGGADAGGTGATTLLLHGRRPDAHPPPLRQQRPRPVRYLRHALTSTHVASRVHRRFALPARCGGQRTRARRRRLPGRADRAAADRSPAADRRRGELRPGLQRRRRRALAVFVREPGDDERPPVFARRPARRPDLLALRLRHRHDLRHGLCLEARRRTLRRGPGARLLRGSHRSGPRAGGGRAAGAVRPDARAAVRIARRRPRLRHDPASGRRGGWHLGRRDRALGPAGHLRGAVRDQRRGRADAPAAGAHRRRGRHLGDHRPRADAGRQPRHHRRRRPERRPAPVSACRRHRRGRAIGRFDRGVGRRRRDVHAAGEPERRQADDVHRARQRHGAGDRAARRHGGRLSLGRCGRDVRVLATGPAPARLRRAGSDAVRRDRRRRRRLCAGVVRGRRRHVHAADASRGHRGHPQLHAAGLPGRLLAEGHHRAVAARRVRRAAGGRAGNATRGRRWRLRGGGIDRCFTRRWFRRGDRRARRDRRPPAVEAAAVAHDAQAHGAPSRCWR